jgi:hypothetical protein
MRGSLWGIVLAAVGVITLLVLPSAEAVPSSPTNSTQAVETTLSALGPAVGQLLMLAAAGALVYYTLK